MSELVLSPFSTGILRLASLPVSGTWVSGAWASELRELDRVIEFESKLEFAERELYILFESGRFYVARSVLGDPYSLSHHFPVFDLELSSSFPVDYPKAGLESLLASQMALCPLPSERLFSKSLPSFYILSPGTLALVNS